MAIFACQWRNGMLPQIRFMPGQHGYRPDADDWGVTPAVSGPTRLRTSGITQPPIIGVCAYEVFRKIAPHEREAHCADFLAIADGLEKYHDWLFRERDPWRENLVLCLHPWETGTDNSPAFDPLIEATRAYITDRGLPVDTFGRTDMVHVKGEHRPTEHDYTAYVGLLALFKRYTYSQQAITEHSPFLLQDVLFNSLFASSLDALARLEDGLAYVVESGTDISGRLNDLAARNRERDQAVKLAIRSKLWSERDGLFFSYDSRGKRLLRTPTVSSLMPLMAGVATPAQADALVAHLLDPTEFWTPVPIPSMALNSTAFNPQRYWSGPSWPVTNWLVILGLRERGLPLVEELRARTLRMISEGADEKRVHRAAIGVMEQNSFGEEFTTPSTRQYAHAWLWDSTIVAVSWPLVRNKPTARAPQEDDPGFWEYYDPLAGTPLGAAHMTWTASLFLELEKMGQ